MLAWSHRKIGILNDTKMSQESLQHHTSFCDDVITIIWYIKLGNEIVIPFLKNTQLLFIGFLHIKVVLKSIFSEIFSSKKYNRSSCGLNLLKEGDF